MAKTRPLRSPCTRGIYLIFLWTKTVMITAMGRGIPSAVFAYPSSGSSVLLPPKACTWTVFHWGPSSPGIAGLQEQKASVLASLHLNLPAPTRLTDENKNPSLCLRSRQLWAVASTQQVPCRTWNSPLDVIWGTPGLAPALTRIS